MLSMTVELISVAFLFLIFVVLFCVIKMYLAVIALCEQRAYPLQGPEMRGRHRADRERAARGRVARRNRQTVTQTTGRRAEPQEHDERL